MHKQNPQMLKEKNVILKTNKKVVVLRRNDKNKDFYTSRKFVKKILKKIKFLKKIKKFL